jgi:hypothetical protein
MPLPRPFSSSVAKNAYPCENASSHRELLTTKPIVFTSRHRYVFTPGGNGRHAAAGGISRWCSGERAEPSDRSTNENDAQAGALWSFYISPVPQIDLIHCGTRDVPQIDLTRDVLQIDLIHCGTRNGFCHLAWGWPTKEAYPRVGRQREWNRNAVLSPRNRMVSQRWRYSV